MTQKAYIITGPTASGKSGFAHLLARHTNGTIINCDSVQIYRDIENISASPFANQPVSDTIEDIPYRLFSILSLTSQISVSEYLDMAKTAYEESLSANKTPIFVGGTGYYINALINGISPMPGISDQSRERARNLVASDINLARKILPPEFTATDPQRIARALEVYFETNHHITEYQKKPRIGAVIPNAKRILISPPPDILRNRIAQRIPEMISGGAIDEAKKIIESGWDTRRAIGAAQLCSYLHGEKDIDDCITDWTNKTNQYAKRQRTWFRTQYNPDVIIPHTPTNDDIETVI